MTTSVTLQVTLPGGRNGFKASFATEDQALGYMDRKPHLRFDELGGDSWEDRIPSSWDRLLDRLYPTCEHGLSANLCAGPQHYDYDADEWSAYGLI